MVEKRADSCDCAVESNRYPASMQIRSLIAAELDRLKAFRHDLHQHPEICYVEVRTAARIRAELTDAGVPFVAGLAGGTGTLAAIDGNASRAIALRTDIDALPIHEVAGRPWCSKISSRMHACGHDGHTTIMIGAARVLAKMAAQGALPNPVTMLFQPAEEGGAGGKRMVEDGALDGSKIGKPVRRIYGLHGWPGLPRGTISTRKGALFAASDRFEITVTGGAAHAAWPHHGRDPVLAAAAIVVALGQIVSREIDPLHAAVVSTTMIHGGTASNQIPETVELAGTARALRNDTQDHLEKRIIEIAQSVARAHRCEAHGIYHRGYPVTYNEDASVDEFERIMGAALGRDKVVPMELPVMGGEDFAYYAQKVPSCFYLLGLDEPTSPSAKLHHPTFDFNDDAIATGVEAMVRLAIEDLGED